MEVAAAPIEQSHEVGVVAVDEVHDMVHLILSLLEVVRHLVGLRHQHIDAVGMVLQHTVVLQVGEAGGKVLVLQRSLVGFPLLAICNSI